MRYAKVGVGVAAASLAGLLGAGPGSAQTGGGTQATFKQATFTKQAARPQHLTTAVQMTKDQPAPARAFTGPTSMLVHPSNPRIIVAATADLRMRVCNLLRSTDAGHTWHIAKGIPSPTTHPYCTNGTAGQAEAAIAWGRNGTLYYAMNAFGEGEGTYTEGHTSTVLARSTNLGESWSTTLVENNRGKTGVVAADYGASVAVDTSGPRDVVYVGYNQFFPDAPPDSPVNNGPVMIATSTDGGVTFGPPVNVSDFSHLTRAIAGKTYPLLFEGFFGAPMLLAHDGVVLVVSGSETPFDNHPEGGGNFDTRFAYAMPQLVARSTDQGRNWSLNTLGPPIFAAVGSQTGMGWISKGGAKGTFVAAYAGSPETATSSGTPDILFQRSTDGGVTWSDPVAIDDDSPDKQNVSFYPQLGVAPNGRIDVVWQDNRDTTDYRFNVRYTYSADGGATWAPNVLVSDQPLNFNLGVNFNSDLRQPPGVASANQYAAVGWSETRLGNELTQTQDDFGSVVQFSALPATRSKVLPVLAAIFGGLVAAGIILLVVLGMRRGRGGPAPSSVSQTQPISAR